MSEQKQCPPFVELADFLYQHRDDIIRRLVSSVGGRIDSTARLTHEQVKDHLPALFEELEEDLRAGRLDADCDMETEARRHGVHRWKQGYSIEELLREMGIVRRVMLAECLTKFFDGQGRDWPVGRKRDAKALVHEFFNRVTDTSVRQFVDEKSHTIQQYSEQLEQANRRLQVTDASRLRLIRTLCHELRNILNGMASAVALLDFDQVDRRKVRRLLQRQIDDMTALLNQLLDYSMLIVEREEAALDSLQVETLFEDLLLTYKPLAEARGLSLTGSLDPDLVQVITDALKLKQIAGNLLSNAVKYTESGTIRLVLRVLDAGHWELAVEDTGMGIPDEDQARVFEEFHRIGPADHSVGLGLGLAITKRLVTLLGGSISVRSEPGRGSCFRVRLPR